MRYNDDANACANYFKVDYLGPESSKWQSDTRNGFSISSKTATPRKVEPRGIDRIALQRNHKVNDDNACANYFKVDYLGPESSKWHSDTRNGFSVSSINNHAHVNTNTANDFKVDYPGPESSKWYYLVIFFFFFFFFSFSFSSSSSTFFFFVRVHFTKLNRITKMLYF